MSPRKKIYRVNGKRNIKNIKGVPIERCSGFVWSIIRKMGLHSKYNYVINSDDLFQAGFVELLRKSKKYDKSRNVHLFTYLYKTVKGNAIIREIQKSYIIRFPSYFWDLYYKLIKKYWEDRTYYNYPDQAVDFQKLYEDGIINNLSRAGLELCEKLVRNEAILDLELNPQTYLDAVCYVDRPTEKLHRSSPNPRYESYLNESGNEFIRILDSLPEISDISKEIFIRSYGIGCEETSPIDLAKQYGIARNSVYRMRKRVREALLEDGEWLEDNFGEKMLKKLRSKEAVT